MNWGHGIIIAFGLFVAYILYFVYASFQQNIDLVSEDYYAQEVAYQQRIDDTKNAVDVKGQIFISRNESEVVVTFPIEIREKITTGEVHFFRPADQQMDFKIPLQLDAAASLRVDGAQFSAGRYEVKISWKEGEKAYFVKKDLFI